MAKKPTFEEALKQLETIAEQIERGQIGLEESIVKYEQGMTLVKQCREILAKAELAAVSAERAWLGELRLDLAKAEAGATPGRHLELVRPISSRLGALGSSCLKNESRRAAALAKTAAANLAAPGEDELLKRLPADSTLASDIAAIRADRARRLEAATTPEKVAAPKKTAPPARKAASK